MGDLTSRAEYWLTDPKKPSRVTGSVGLGLKSDTGSVDESGTLFTPGGDAEGAVDEAFQLGDGGWGVLLRAQGTAQFGGPWFGYASGYYLLSLEDHYDVMQGGNFRGVPDLYSARLGGAYQIPAYKALVVTLGGLVNGAPVKDVIGGGDLIGADRGTRSTSSRASAGPTARGRSRSTIHCGCTRTRRTACSTSPSTGESEQTSQPI